MTARPCVYSPIYRARPPSSPLSLSVRRRPALQLLLALDSHVTRNRHRFVFPTPNLNRRRYHPPPPCRFASNKVDTNKSSSTLSLQATCNAAPFVSRNPLANQRSIVRLQHTENRPTTTPRVTSPVICIPSVSVPLLFLVSSAPAFSIITLPTHILSSTRQTHRIQQYPKKQFSLSYLFAIIAICPVYNPTSIRHKRRSLIHTHTTSSWRYRCPDTYSTYKYLHPSRILTNNLLNLLSS